MPLPVWLSRFFRPHQPLPAGMHSLQTETQGAPHRLHLRIEPDGNGLLIVDAATILHLNQTAAEYAFHLVHNTPPQQAARRIARRYRVSLRQARSDYERFREQVYTLLQRPDLDPVQFIGLERAAPYSRQVTAPYRLDCALTYRLPEGQSPLAAPLKRVERELTLAEWQHILDLAWQHGVPHILFTGGEPTLRDDLPDLIAHAEANGQVTGLLSDGLRLADRDYLNTLLQTGLDHLLMVLQPENPAAWEALERILPQDLHTSVHLTLTPQNAARAGEIIKRLADLGANALS
ncbi:MAG: radical SAM protein, partial [Anaerolineae bacterium]